jgi:hypothetical protein
MADAPYLVALALVKRGEQRALPLTGLSLPAATAEAADPGALGHRLVLELLLRLWQGSDANPLARAAAEDSLLLLELPFDALPLELPSLKARWLAGGATAELLAAFAALAPRIWRPVFRKGEPLTLEPWSPPSSPPA